MKEVITELINKSNFCENDLELSSEEGVILKEHAYHILDIRYELFMESKKEEKVKKYLFNKQKYANIILVFERRIIEVVINGLFIERIWLVKIFDMKFMNLSI